MNGNPTQMAEALVKANKIRRARMIILGRIAELPTVESCREAADLIENPPVALLSLPVDKLLIRVRGIGPERSQALVEEIGAIIPPTLQALTSRRRELLSELLRARAAAWRCPGGVAA